MSLRIRHKFTEAIMIAKKVAVGACHFSKDACFTCIDATQQRLEIHAINFAPTLNYVLRRM